MGTYAFSNATNKSMNRLRLYMQFIAAAILMSGMPWLLGESPDSNHVTVPLSDPSRPAHLRAHLLNGSITVKAYQGKEIIVDAKVRAGESGEDEPERQPKSTLRRVPTAWTGLSVWAGENRDRGTPRSHPRSGGPHTHAPVPVPSAPTTAQHS